MSQARFAIYFTPHPESRLARFGAAILGYDCHGAREVPRLALDGIDPAVRARAATEPIRYGFHATLMAPFGLAPACSAAALNTALGDFAVGRAPLPIGPLKVARIGGFIALVPAAPQPGIAALAGDCLGRLDRFRAGLSAGDRERRLAAGLSPRQIELLDRWGYPYVFSEFRFHMTLTGSLPSGEREIFQTALAAAFAELADEPVTIDAVSLMGQDDRAARFRVLDRKPLTG